MARETKAARAARATQIVTILEQTFPLSKIALDYRTPWELLVATILAAQCTDARVNEVTPDLFNRYPTPRALANASQEELEKVIFTTGFYRNKAKSIRGAAAAVVERFRGKVPGTMDQLLTIPGIGRKSANVILGHCFGVPGVVVDTHVKRITNLNGLVKTEDPEKIEFELMKLVPRDRWIRMGHLYQDLGRTICIARRPKCPECPVSTLCDYGRKSLGGRA